MTQQDWLDHMLETKGVDRIYRRDDVLAQAIRLAVMGKHAIYISERNNEEELQERLESSLERLKVSSESIKNDCMIFTFSPLDDWKRFEAMLDDIGRVEGVFIETIDRETEDEISAARDIIYRINDRYQCPVWYSEWDAQ